MQNCAREFEINFDKNPNLIRDIIIRKTEIQMEKSKQAKIDEIRENCNLNKRAAIFFDKEEIITIVEQAIGREFSLVELEDISTKHLFSQHIEGWSSQKTVEAHPNKDNVDTLLRLVSPLTLDGDEVTQLSTDVENCLLSFIQNGLKPNTPLQMCAIIDGDIKVRLSYKMGLTRFILTYLQEDFAKCIEAIKVDSHIPTGFVIEIKK